MNMEYVKGLGKTESIGIFQFIEGRHAYWWLHLLNNVKVPDNFDKTPPRIEYDFTFKKRHIASAWNHKCKYNLHHAIFRRKMDKAQFDNIIAHEVCHSFAGRLYPGEKHNNLWKYLVQVVCGFNKEEAKQPAPHLNNPLPEVDTLKQFLKLMQQQNLLKEKVQ